MRRCPRCFAIRSLSCVSLTAFLTFEHDRRIADHAYVNKMSADNLAIVLCPVFLWDKKISATTMITESSECALVIETMIQHADSLFADEDDDTVRLAEKDELDDEEADDDDDNDDQDDAVPPLPPQRDLSAPSQATLEENVDDSVI